MKDFTMFKLKIKLKYIFFILLIFIYNNAFSGSVNDSKITQDVKDKLSIYNQHGLDVDVTTKKGITSLIGDVNSRNEAIILIEITESVPGVKDVNASRLTINEDFKLNEDENITAKIKGAFIREKIYGEMIANIPFEIKTVNGLVHLDGKIKNKSKLEDAIQVIHTINGVKDVASQITITDGES